MIPAYYYISLAILLAAFLIYFIIFEKQHTRNGRLVVVAVMAALSVIGRFIPFFKPIAAITIITGVYLGGEAGFLVGALAAFISNFFFGQGPWTPFQMMAFGVLGVIAAFLARLIKKSRIVLGITGFLAGVLYSFIMDIWTVLWYSKGFDFELYKTAIATALPFTLLYSVSNIIFLLLLAKPIGEKLERIKLKYGI